MAAAESIRVEIYTGKVAWFDKAKGYGFIQCVELDRDVYVHFSNIAMEGFKFLSKDQHVTFEMGAGIHKGRVEAKSVKVVE